MKRMVVIILSVLMIFSLSGCNRILGAAILENFGMEFTSQIELMEECLDIDLDDLNDSYIKTIYSDTDPDGNDLTIRYPDLGGAGEVIENGIIHSAHWKALPLDSKTKNLYDMMIKNN